MKKVSGEQTQLSYRSGIRQCSFSGVGILANPTTCGKNDSAARPRTNLPLASEYLAKPVN